MRPAARNARTVRTRIAHLGLVLAWLLATGMHLDVLQLYAWTSMGFRFAQTEGAAQAVVSTFKEERMCHLCHAVQAARKQERKDPAVAPDQSRPDLVFLAVATVTLAPPANPTWRWSSATTPEIDRPRPPLPPPRDHAFA